MAGDSASGGALPTVVLVIDDDEFVRGALVRQFERLGIRAVAADSGATGLRIMATQGPFEAVVCDLRMPGMDGVQFLRHLASEQPGTRVVLISAQEPKVIGLAGQLVNAHGLQLLGVLPKPVALEDLRRVMSGTTKSPSVKDPSGQVITVDDLRRAIEREEIQAFVQPKVNTSDGRLAGAEALARWLPEGRPPIYPDSFILLAEQTGLIDSLTDLMLRQALRSCGEWASQGVATRIAINVAPVTLHRLDLPETITELAAGFGVKPEQIIVEVTESSLFSDESLSLDVLTRLRLRGIALSIDDFGTGYSSLKQLQRLPFSELKIDRSFVAGMIDDPAAARIVESTLRLARDLGVQSATAEGVETEAQLQQLARLGCAYAQGYYIAKPMPRGQLLEWAARSGRR